MIPIGKHTAKEQDQKAEGQDQKANTRQGKGPKARGTGPKGRETGPKGRETEPKGRGTRPKGKGQNQKAKCAYLFCSLKGDDLLGLLNALLNGTAAGHSLCLVDSRLGPLAGAGTQSVLCACFNAIHSTNQGSTREGHRSLSARQYTSSASKSLHLQ